LKSALQAEHLACNISKHQQGGVTGIFAIEICRILPFTSLVFSSTQPTDPKQETNGMSKNHAKRMLLATTILLGSMAALPAFATNQGARTGCIGILPPQLPPLLSSSAPTTPPDSGLFISYRFSNGYTDVYWSVCGSTQDSEGCYRGGTLGPFGKVGAIIEGNPMVNKARSTVTRNIYVVDEAVGGGTGVALNVFTKTDVVTATYDTVTITLTNTITLPSLTGGSNAKTYMAASNNVLFIGTDRSGSSVEVRKADLAISDLGEAGGNINSITADQYGFVTVNYADGGFDTYNPDGNGSEGGGGTEFMAGTQTALSTSNLATDTNIAISASLAARMKVSLKKMTSQNAPGN
jgi:hypothetical protein